MQMILDAIKSKKFQVTLLSVLALVCTGLAGTMPWSEVIKQAAPLVMAYLVGQGLADFGKNKAVAELREAHRLRSLAAPEGDKK